MRIGFFFREALRAFGATRARFAALATVLVTCSSSACSCRSSRRRPAPPTSVRSKVAVDIYLKATPAGRQDRVRRSCFARRTSARCVHLQGEAYPQQSKLNPKAYRLLGANPLPDTYRVIPDNPYNTWRLKAVAAKATAGGTRMSTAIQRSPTAKDTKKSSRSRMW